MALWIRYMQSSRWAEVRLSEIREEKEENSPAQRGKRRHCLSECGVNLGLASECGVELCLSLVGVWGGVEVSLERYSNHVRSV